MFDPSLLQNPYIWSCKMKKYGDDYDTSRNLQLLAINRSKGLYLTLKLNKPQWLIVTGLRVDWEFNLQTLRCSYLFGNSKIPEVFSVADVCLLEKVIFWWEVSNFK